MTRSGKHGAASCGRTVLAAAAAFLVWGVLPAGAPSAATAAGEAAGPAVGLAPGPACRFTQLVANSAERLGPTELRITVINEGPRACVLRGHPTLAVAGHGSPDQNRPLVARSQGAARPVLLPVGGTAETRVSFTPVLGEADGYCDSGDEPTVAPSMVMGLAGGRLQLAPDDGGNFALCGTVVRASAFRASS
ncbi:DUF4232 domain-containing protein [Streptomyces sp. NPDC059851]|uniref:DUF4232 domain-containing protein n=1 Tax=Streptomyces sp. NPDC059851 TaxID=3346971 RepID=UPI00364666EE